MNRVELVEKISEKAKLSKKDTDKVIRIFLDTVTDALAEGDRIQILGFGTFESVKRQTRTVRNPKTGEIIDVPETNIPKLKFAKNVKEKLNKNN